jgi:hypothetical protein
VDPAAVVDPRRPPTDTLVHRAATPRSMATGGSPNWLHTTRGRTAAVVSRGRSGRERGGASDWRVT